MFENINLEKRHEEIIRKMLLSQGPGKPNQYGCIMFLLDNVNLLSKIIWSPVKDTIDGFTCYKFFYRKNILGFLFIRSVSERY